MCLLRVHTQMWKLSCLILLLHCAIAQRVSKWKCDETLSLNTDSRSLQPHLMELLELNGENLQLIGQGTLISEDYVLTSGFIDMVLSKENVYVRKSKLLYENYSNTKLFDIKRIIGHELLNKPFTYINDIALVQLTESIPYRSTTSIFRPACLWTDSTEPSNTYQLYVTVTQQQRLIRRVKLISKEYTAVSIDKCTSTHNFRYYAMGFSDDVISASTVNSHMCFDLQRGFEVRFGSPIMYKQGNKHFIIAIIGNTDANDDNGNLGFGTKVSNYIEWIESIVWPNPSDVECGKRNIAHTPFMYYGQPTYHGEFPWHVGLFRNQRYICGGTIISKTAIVTAAHCVQDDRGILPANRLTVITGTHRINEFPIEAQNHGVRNVMVHENYTRSHLKNDIAILKVNGLIEFSDYIQPICLSDTVPYKDFPGGTIAGWGANEYNNGSDVLLQAMLPIFSTAACLEKNPSVMARYLNENNYCAGILNGTNVGAGDSGGGMVFEYQSQWYLRGIVSLGIAIPNTDRVDPLHMAFFSDVSLFYDWIREHTEEDN